MSKEKLITSWPVGSVVVLVEPNTTEAQFLVYRHSETHYGMACLPDTHVWSYFSTEKHEDFAGSYDIKAVKSSIKYKNSLKLNQYWKPEGACTCGSSD